MLLQSKLFFNSNICGSLSETVEGSLFSAAYPVVENARHALIYFGPCR